ncbi:receptor activity-modifying protein 2 isoform X2 [Trachinotus anak]|uniref:receptor activity-modifying protein 2 isoform X2 n=1 Tax=Trachinotus anak TaxID=443729 RepID=UPI0039F1B405
MMASCCFIEASCTKVEICNPYPTGRKGRAVSGNMTATNFSLMFSGCFMTLLIWGCTTVDGLVDEQLAVQPATTAGYYSREMMTANATYGESLKFACGNTTHNCMSICEICDQISGGPTMECLSVLFKALCLSKFHSAMESLNDTDWCNWDNVRGSYSSLSLCTEEMSDCLLIPWPNPLVEKTFVNIHSKFFKDCPTEELNDPPPVIVFALVITPICLIPVMVSLVVLKTKNGDGSS